MRAGFHHTDLLLAAAIREALHDNAELLETSADLKGFRDAVLASLKEFSAKLGSSPIVEEPAEKVEEKKPVMEEKKPATEEKKPMMEEKKPVMEEKKPVMEEKKPAIEEKKPEPVASAPPPAAVAAPSAPVVATPVSAAPSDDGRNRATTAMELAELEREQRQLELDQKQLESEQRALEEAHSQVFADATTGKALGATPAGTTAPATAFNAIEELAAAIVVQKTVTVAAPADHSAIFDLFNGLEMATSAVDSLVSMYLLSCCFLLVCDTPQVL